jgi:riboflavin transporter FmnP
MISNKKKYSVNTMTKVSILSVIAFIVMFIEAPIFLFPGFLKIDLSDVPALVAGFALGPAAGVAVELLKNILHLLRTSTGGVGEIANFIIGASMVAPAAFIYHKRKDKHGALLGLFIGVIIMSLVGALANYFILIPFYQNFMPIDAIIGMSAKANSLIVDVKTLIIYGVMPFNLFKGLVVSIFTMLLYKRISGLLK